MVENVGMIDSYLQRGQELSTDEINYDKKFGVIKAIEFVNNWNIGGFYSILEAANDVDGVFDLAVKNKLLPRGVDKIRFINRVEVAFKIIDALKIYEPRCVVDNSFVFCASEPLEGQKEGGFDANYDRGWGELGGAYPVMIGVGGTHKTIMDFPHLNTLAEKFNELLC